MYFKSAVEEKKPVLCPETGSGGWSYIRKSAIFSFGLRVGGGLLSLNYFLHDKIT